METVREICRGAAAVLAGFAVMAGLVVAALAVSGVPVSWAFVATVLGAAVGGGAVLAGSLDAGAVGAVLHGAVDVVPLAVSAAGALVFCAVLVGPLRLSARRAVGALAAIPAVLAVVVAAPDAVAAIPVPAGAGQAVREAPLVIRADTGDTVTGGLLTFAVLTGFCLLVAVLPNRRVVVTAAAAVPMALLLGGLVLAALAAAHRPALAAPALLLGANAVVLAGLGSSPVTLSGPLAAKLSSATGGLSGAGTFGVRLTAVLVLAVLIALVVATVPPGPDRRWPRAGRQALVAATVLAAVAAATSLAAAGSLTLGLQVLVLRADVLTAHLTPAAGAAALAGAVAGGLGGLLGSLMADIRWRDARVTATASGRG
ncbi:hypothetical protein AB0F81_32815 [Actinoplanes sp. NPDC024001]|uniref:hypothetical protein n=1 Tax=Actinoplanes sp. NPDC024001 TaxID=3154598 RepID=UPI00340FF9FD